MPQSLSIQWNEMCDGTTTLELFKKYFSIQTCASVPCVSNNFLTLSCCSSQVLMARAFVCLYDKIAGKSSWMPRYCWMSFHAVFAFADVSSGRLVQIILYKSRACFVKGYHGEVQHPRHIANDRPILSDEFRERRKRHDFIRIIYCAILLHFQRWPRWGNPKMLSKLEFEKQGNQKVEHHCGQ